MKTKRQWHEYRARYARALPHHDEETGEFTFKAKGDGDARGKAIHLLRARGVRYKFRLEIEKVINKGEE